MVAATTSTDSGQVRTKQFRSSITSQGLSSRAKQVELNFTSYSMVSAAMVLIATVIIAVKKVA